MKKLKFERLKKRLKEEFSENIYDEDIKGREGYEQKWISRAYTAYVISMIGKNNPPFSAKYVTDGYNDNGIDGIYKDEENKKLVFLQTKFSETSSIDLGDVEKFLKGVSRVLELNIDDFNDHITNRKNEIHEVLLDFDYSIELLIVLGSNQKISMHTEKTLNEFKKKLDDNEGMVNYRVIYFDDVYNHMADSKTLDNIVIENFYLENYGKSISDSGQTVYYGVVSAENIAELKQEYGNSILQKNIRYFKKDTDVNNGIINILKEEPQNFYLYNNGIKIIANKIEKAPIFGNDKSIAILKLEGASIINGAQTTGCLLEVYKEDKSKLQDVKIQVQLISLHNLEEGMAEKITKYSNTQNKIDNKDFAVQDPTQEQLKRDLAIDGIIYSYKQGEDEIEAEDAKICYIDEATVALGCLSNDINITTTIKRAYGSIYDDLTKPPYKAIFNSGTSPQKLWNSVLVYREFQKVEENFKKDPDKSYQRLISVHGNRMLLHLVLNDIEAEEEMFSTEYINDISKLNVYDKYIKFLDGIFKAKDSLYPDAYPAYIFKNSNKCKKIKEELKNFI
ncbi:AIPR family protein [Macrococcoides caseolyticum]|uniref:AIPR family protein n=1 Tax=Macrococcoides caseolyticum TaxID=69966 RepID=UPI001C5D3EB1|nr:AIPR family protein [Macrococcus caseolyticus]QYA40294.1 AIPR family protein [Macrococcus caseolyticus]